MARCRIAFLLLSSVFFASQRDFQSGQLQDSGGPLSAEQACYDVLDYSLHLAVEPAEKSIQGTAQILVRIVHPTDALVFDLEDALSVSRVAEGYEMPLAFEHAGGKLSVSFDRTLQPGTKQRVIVSYGGQPRVAVHPPWLGGFTWSQTEDGLPWVGVSCQLEGADSWRPVKDHPSDEPDRTLLMIQVPKPLEAVANGVLTRVDEDPDGRRTFFWESSDPINNYGVSINIAPYVRREGSYQSVTGRQVPMYLWVLPEHSGVQADFLWDEMQAHLRFLEETVGPYPFRGEKYGVAETPYLGMEHQTIIAYGSTFKKNSQGFDWLHFHELAHEWFGNLATASDWKDIWIHEGFASYLEALYAERLGGDEARLGFMRGLRRRIRNAAPVAPLESRTIREKYFVPPDYKASDGDVNFKGAWVLQSLRHLIGDKAFFRFLRSVAYPDSAKEKATDGTQCHFISTTDVIALAQVASNRDLGWFFDAYLRQVALPKLEATLEEGKLKMRWMTEAGTPFPMPVDVMIGASVQRVAMAHGQGEIAVPGSDAYVIDPGRWILFDEME